LVALAGDAAEQPPLLEDEGPGDQGEEEKDRENSARDPTGLRENVKDVADKDGG
jgi:hypothetical protein